MSWEFIDNLESAVIDPESLPSVINWQDVFGNQNPLGLALGSGNGDFLVNAARSFPGKNFIGIELARKYFLKSARKIVRYGLKNVRVVNMDCVKAINELFQPDQADSIYINCPDPWPKRKHHKRRIFKPVLINGIYRVLIPGGEVIVTTDIKDYAWMIFKKFNAVAGFKNTFGDDFCSSGIENYPRSYYQAKWEAQGRKIYFLRFVKAE